MLSWRFSKPGSALHLTRGARFPPLRSCLREAQAQSDSHPRFQGGLQSGRCFWFRSRSRRPFTKGLLACAFRVAPVWPQNGECGAKSSSPRDGAVTSRVVKLGWRDLFAPALLDAKMHSEPFAFLISNTPTPTVLQVNSQDPYCGHVSARTYACSDTFSTRQMRVVGMMRAWILHWRVAGPAVLEAGEGLR